MKEILAYILRGVSKILAIFPDIGNLTASGILIFIAEILDPTEKKSV